MAQYKDSLFRTWFNTEEGALELYNALHDTRYDETAEVIINTLTETLWTGRKNDVSFLFKRKQVVLAEHQSTINWNMPFRFIDPVRRLFEQSISDKRAVYQKRLIRLPRPEFIVIYNGLDAYPECGIIRLSDAFESGEGFCEASMELAVKVYNVNEGYNEAVKGRSERLKGYSFFVGRVRLHEADGRVRGMGRKAAMGRAIRRAVADSMDAGYMKAFWERITEEDIAMLWDEWDINLALEVCKEESFEEGLQTGLERGVQTGKRERDAELIALINKGYSLEQIRDTLTGMSV
jgi:hypothetical protein